MAIPDHVQGSIEAMAGVHGRAERHMTVHQRRSERLTVALARPSFLYAMLGVVVVSAEPSALRAAS